MSFVKKPVVTALVAALFSAAFFITSAFAATPVAVWDGDFNNLTKFTGYELLDWNETHGENKSSVTIDRANHGLMFNADSAMPGMTILVRYSNLTVGSSKKVLFTSCVNSNHSGYRTGVRLGTDGKINGMWGTADFGTADGSVPESGVMAFVYSTAGTYLYAAEKGTERLAQVWGNSALKSSGDTAIYGGSAGGFCDGSSISGFSAASGMTIEAIAVFNSVISLSDMQDYIWPDTEDVSAVARTVAADATVNWTDAAWTVGETADQTFTPSSDALYNVIVTVGGDCSIVMPESIGNFNRRRIKFVLDNGVASATVALKYSGALPQSGSTVSLNPFGDALVLAGSGVTLSPEYNGNTDGYLVSVSDLTLTIVSGPNYEGTLTADTNWSDIKPEGWVDVIAGSVPSIAVSYEGENPITLTFDVPVQAGLLTLTGNIVVEASASAAFGTVNAGAGSVVEMANMTITTPSGAGTYRYRSDYPSQVPSGTTYEYVGGASDAETATVGGQCDVYGYLKTSGYIAFADFAHAQSATFDVLSGKASVNCGEAKLLKGAIYIRENATFENLRESDALNYSGTMAVHVYGTLAMGATRWSLGGNNTINIYENGSVTGTGQSNIGALDCIENATVIFNVNGTATIAAPVRIRGTATARIEVASGKTLTLSGGTIGIGNVDKRLGGVLKFTGNPSYSEIAVGNGTLQFDTQSDVDQVVTYDASVLASADMAYVSASNWKGRVVVNAVAAGNAATKVALDKTGNANSYLTLNEISGNAWCAGSTYTVQPAITLAGNVNFQNGSSKQTVTFRKIAAGSGNLSLKRWYGCTGITYGFTTLDADNYTGTIQLDGSEVTFNVGDILKANASVGNVLVPITIANDAKLGLSGATLNGVSTNFCYSTVNDVTGLYIAAAKIGNVSYPTLQAALDARRAGTSGAIIVLDGSSAIPEGYVIDNGRLVRKAFFIKLK